MKETKKEATEIGMEQYPIRSTIEKPSKRIRVAQPNESKLIPITNEVNKVTNVDDTRTRTILY